MKNKDQKFMITTKLPRVALFVLTCLLLVNFSWAQTSKVNFNGYIKDKESGEVLIAANVYISELEIGVATNVYGYFSLSVPPGKYTVRITYVGYDELKQVIDITERTNLTFELVETSIQGEEIVISAERQDQNVTSSEMSKIEIQADEIKEIPVLFGETDIIKTIQLLPGIQSTGDGNSGFYVRGGGPDQNLILVDDAVVYNASHLFGFFSVFNADAVKNVSIIKGGIPSEYGGRLSSVLNVTLKEGNARKMDAAGGLGIISSRLLLEGPLIKDKSSFMIAGRRTYADVLIQPFLNEQTKGNRYFFYDLNTKLNYKFSDKDRLFLSGYFGKDVFKFKDNASTSLSPPEFGSDWGNSTVTLRWNHLYSDKLFSNTSFIFSDYYFSFDANFNSVNFNLKSSIRDYNLKSDYEYFANVLTKIKFGVNAIHHTFNPTAVNFNVGEQEVELNSPDRIALEYAAYFQVERDITEHLNINVGLRASAFNNIGPFTQAEYDEAGRLTGDSITYGKGESIKWYQALEPRFSFRYITSKTSSVKGSFTKTNQYLHLASISGGTLPTDLWLPSSPLIKPQIAYQGALGFFKNLKDNTYETSIETFYKPMLNQIDFEPGTNLFLASEVDRNVLSGTGLAYGLELFVKKKKGKFTGWIGYTLSKTSRTVEQLNNGDPYSPRYDRRHDISVLGTYKFNDQWKVSVVWVYATGIAYTPGVGRFFGNIGVNNEFKPLFDVITVYPDEFNSFRLRAYQRVDLSIIYKPKTKKVRKWSGEWNLSVFNMLNRKNPYFVFYETDFSTGTNTAKMIYFPIIPSISYNFKF